MGKIIVFLLSNLPLAMYNLYKGVTEQVSNVDHRNLQSAIGLCKASKS